MRFDDEDQMHSETGPALRFRDGSCLYYWHGTKIPAELITEKLTPRKALRIENAEHRRAAIVIDDVE